MHSPSGTCRSTGYDRYLRRGEAGLQDRPPKPKHVWNPLPGRVCAACPRGASLTRCGAGLLSWRLKETELSPRELAVTLADTESYPRHGP